MVSSMKITCKEYMRYTISIIGQMQRIFVPLKYTLKRQIWKYYHDFLPYDNFIILEKEKIVSNYLISQIIETFHGSIIVWILSLIINGKTADVITFGVMVIHFKFHSSRQTIKLRHVLLNLKFRISVRLS